MATGVCALLPLGYFYFVATATETRYPDFFGLWSFGRYVLTYPPATVYDGEVMQAFQVGLGMPVEGSYPFFYPPFILLLLAPFGALPYPVALGTWLLLTCAAYVVALAAWRWPWPVVGLLLAAPSTAVCAIVGQNGFATAALTLGGLRLLRTRPLLAGTLLGLMACKPQLAILLPFLLLFGRHWLAIAGAALSAAVLTLAATLAFGPDIWAAWVAYMRGHAAMLAGGRSTLFDMMPSLTAAVNLLGGGAGAAYAVQAAGALAGLYAVWRVRTHDGPEAHVVVALATVLATPYAFHYDLPMVTGAVLAVAAARMAGAEGFKPFEFPVLLACALAPAILPARLGATAAVVPVALSLGLWMMCRTAAPRGIFDGAALPHAGLRARVRE